MTPPQPVLRIRREDLARALRLSATDLRILIHLIVHACSSTGCVWELPEQIAAKLGLPETVVAHALHELAAADFLEEHPTLLRQLRCVELGTVFLRSTDAPANVPVEPHDV